MLTAVAAGKLSLDRLVALMATNPRRIYGLPSQPDTWVEVEIGRSRIIDDEGLLTKCGWSPFSGMKVQGYVHRVQLRGRTVYRDGLTPIVGSSV